MTEREAWLKLADAWDVAAYGPGIVVAVVNGVLECSLCGSVRSLDISRETRDAMIARLRELGDCSTYVWTRDLTGARCRAAFCRKQVVELDELECTLGDEEAAHQDTLRLLSLAQSRIRELEACCRAVVEVSELCRKALRDQP